MLTPADSNTNPYVPGQQLISRRARPTDASFAAGRLARWPGEPTTRHRRRNVGGDLPPPSAPPAGGPNWHATATASRHCRRQAVGQPITRPAGSAPRAFRSPVIRPPRALHWIGPGGLQQPTASDASYFHPHRFGPHSRPPWQARCQPKQPLPAASRPPDLRHQATRLPALRLPEAAGRRSAAQPVLVASSLTTPVDTAILEKHAAIPFGLPATFGGAEIIAWVGPEVILASDVLPDANRHLQKVLERAPSPPPADEIERVRKMYMSKFLEHVDRNQIGGCRRAP